MSYPTKLEDDKSSGQMIWTNLVRLEKCDTWIHRNPTRKEIDGKLIATGLDVRDKKYINRYESLCVAVRDNFLGQQIWTAEGRPKGKSTRMYFDQMDTNPADYMLLVGGVTEQYLRYAASNRKHTQHAAVNDQPLPFLCEITNHEIRFRDERAPHYGCCWQSIFVAIFNY
ncbi:MAG TPA: hypothetical protein EYP90_15575 [Chromatiaceae bacterium]|nr:hypothetical protein [Chromatiaceae bacterium]